MADAAALMDRMYRHQRHVYDLTRKYYLAGRDEAILRLEARPGDTVLEIGCGTGRNLIKAARAYPEARVFGLDVSREMLETAAASIARAGLASRIASARDGSRLDRSRGACVADRDRPGGRCRLRPARAVRP
jgi:S-adenosylmethionine-diacylgycerolhomoserine-N-methlytransferase